MDEKRRSGPLFGHFYFSLRLSLPGFFLVVIPWLVFDQRADAPIFAVVVRWVWLLILITITVLETWSWSRDSKGK